MSDNKDLAGRALAGQALPPAAPEPANGLRPSGNDPSRGLAFYNEIDPVAAATIREAIARGLIAPGVVDERDIRDICPNELAGFTQVHLFAGGGIWSYVARRAGWPDWLPLWSCSCPCQPFSQAGKGGGFDDERHLWPAAQWLIEQCGPVVVVGEQVADKGADPWIDLVQADLEAMDYAFGCVPLASAGFGAPNPRHRTFWLAYAASIGHERSRSAWRGRHGPSNGSDTIRLAYALRQRLAVGSGQANRCGTVWQQGQAAGDGLRDPGPTNGFWANADWLYCRDPRGPRWRPVDAGTFPLAPGHPARVGGLRISGNAINAEVATGFVETVIDVLTASAIEARRAATLGAVHESAVAQPDAQPQPQPKDSTNG
jgi:DNA (cytosine-5)-methyltransferase 1